MSTRFWSTLYMDMKWYLILNKTRNKSGSIKVPDGSFVTWTPSYSPLYIPLYTPYDPHSIDELNRKINCSLFPLEPFNNKTKTKIFIFIIFPVCVRIKF